MYRVDLTVTNGEMRRDRITLAGTATEAQNTVAALLHCGQPLDLIGEAPGKDHPPVSRFLEMRQELGVRNFFHPVARMLNPARATSQVIGLSHPPYFEKTIEALRMLSCPRALVIRGVEGDPQSRYFTRDRLQACLAQPHQHRRQTIAHTVQPDHQLLLGLR